MQATHPPDHFRELDGMRGALAFTVMLHHFGLNTALERVTRGQLTDGAWGLCVDFFFLLSGFVLTRSFVLKPVPFSSFAIKRIGRLAPLFLVTTLAMLAMQPRHLDMATLLANLLVVQSVIGLESINAPGWSIPFELLLPATWLFLLRPRRGSPHVRLLVLILLTVSAAVAYQMGGGATWFTDGPAGLLRASCGLVVGGGLYLLFPIHRPAPRAGWSAAAITAGFCVMALAGRFPAVALVFPALAATAIWLGADTKNGVFSSRPLQALGRWSFAVYLTHIPVLAAAQLLLGVDGTRGPLAKGALILIVLPLSAASYRFLELPCMRLAAGLAQRLLPARHQPAQRG